MHTTVEVFDELNDDQQGSLFKYVKKNNLSLHARDGEDFPDNIQSKKGLSETDKSVLHLALKIKGFILTGDGFLRKISDGNKLEVHGIFWLLDKFVEEKHITKKKACQCITDLMGYNKRLPQVECDKRLEDWGKK